ncbi:DNA helicase IV [Kytococcus aerolatus]|uniref:DNA helicase IV n=1 Tax=Kytococcus aerolatus TaxID=592308 RepID=A0A212U522_9MICO|nr:UvrD-helicase domain-containing protein [Kytococcus aerolatus]SNC73286.1 DNA helicase IV [Kytococcus aerolatus]
MSDPTTPKNATPAQQPTAAERVAAEQLAIEQAHVDRVHTELAKATDRASLVEAEGLARGRTMRTGDVRDEEMSGLFERDALVFSSHKRRASLEMEHEGLVFGRLDLDHSMPDDGPAAGEVPQVDEVRYIGRLGVRDDDYEPLVVDWRAPAASAFYRATPVQPHKVVRRRVLRSRAEQVIGIEDDLMVPEPPEDLPVVGDGALMAALTRSRGGRMRDIVATIQQHQDEAIRAEARGVTLITGGPGTGKTVVALHRAAYLLYTDRRRYERGGVLVIGPSAAYTAYIERVLPTLGEDSVALRAAGDVVDGLTGTRLDSPAAAHVKGMLRIRKVLARAAKAPAPDAPEELRCFVSGHALRIGTAELQRIRNTVLRGVRRNDGAKAAREALAQAAWTQARSQMQGEILREDRERFFDRFEDSREVDAFMESWWRQVDPREVVLWLADAERLAAWARGVLSLEEQEALSASMQVALDTGTWSVADAALVDEVLARIGLPQVEVDTERGFYEIEELEDASQYGVSALKGGQGREETAYHQVTPTTAWEKLLHGSMEAPETYAHLLVDEAQDLSPMQWRMLGRRGRTASWTVVGDAAQASWPDAEEALAARDEAFGSLPRRSFHMDTNYRNASEIFAYAAEYIRRHEAEADIPQAVRETGIEPEEHTVAVSGAESGAWATAATESATELLDAVEGAIAVITPEAHRLDVEAATQELREQNPRVIVIDPMSTKGLEYDATVVVDPEEIVAESPGGARVLYVVFTRAAHRMVVLTEG